MSLPLLPQLPQCLVTVHLTEIANPDIAKVMRLASPLLLSSTPSSLSTPCQDLHVTSPYTLGIPLHMRTLVSPTMILS